MVEKLKKLKKEIEEGASFKLKAIINSDDPGVSQNGGKYTITKDSPFIKEFKEVVFSLDVRIKFLSHSNLLLDIILFNYINIKGKGREFHHIF